MSNTSILIVNAVINPNEKEALGFYQSGVLPLLKAAGGKPIAKYKVTQSLIGESKLQMVILMEFPSEEAITNVFNSEEYNAFIPSREKAFLELNVVIGAAEPLPSPVTA